MTNRRPPFTGRDADRAGAGALMLSVNLMCAGAGIGAGAGAGAGALVGAVVPLALAGLFVGFFLGIAVVAERFRHL